MNPGITLVYSLIARLMHIKYEFEICYKTLCSKQEMVGKRGSSYAVVRHLPLVLEVPGSIPARGEENFGDEHAFPSVICRDDT